MIHATIYVLIAAVVWMLVAADVGRLFPPSVQEYWLAVSGLVGVVIGAAAFILGIHHSDGY